MVDEKGLGIVRGITTCLTPVGQNTISDNTAFWEINVFSGKTIIVHTPAGKHVCRISGNAQNTLVLERPVVRVIPVGAYYEIHLDPDLDAYVAEITGALAMAMEASVDTGTATGGSNTTIVDTDKHWEDGMWEDAVAEVVIDDVHYLRLVTGNTHDTVTINALPGGIECAAGCEYSLKRPVTSVDVTDRAARLLGVVQSLTQWGGTPLTGRDISLDLAHLSNLTPLEQGLLHNEAVVAATDFFDPVLEPTNTPCLFRITVAMDTAGVLSATVTNGGNTQTVHFNRSVNLGVGDLYMFDLLVHDGDTVNLRYSENATIQVCRVQEIVAGVQ